MHADFKFRRHVNTFDWADPNQERREWVRDLRPGQRIQLYATAMYPGWVNFVQRVKMTIHYHKKTQKEDTQDSSAEDLKNFTKSNRTGGDKSGKGPNFRQPKVVIYHQSLHSESGIPTSLHPLASEGTGITAVILGKFQLRFSPNDIAFPMHENRHVSHPALYLNEYKMDDSRDEDFWIDIEYLQRENIKILGMLAMWGDHHNAWGGSAFEHSYKSLHDLMVSRKLDGIDLDLDFHLVEIQEGDTAEEKKRFLLEDVIRLIDNLHADFGSDFIITMTTCAEALLDRDENQQGDNGFPHRALELQRGEFISWYHVRIFSGCSSRRQGVDPSQTGIIDESAPISDGELSSLIRLFDHDEIYSAHKILIAFSKFLTDPNVTGKMSTGDNAA